MNRLKYSLLAIVLCNLGFSGLSLAVPAPPFPIEVDDEQGGKLQVHMRGDEWLSWFEDLDGFAIARHPKTGAWHYAILDGDGALVAGPHPLGKIDPRRRGLPRGLRPSADLRQAVLDTKRQVYDHSSARLPLPCEPQRGAWRVRNLVYLVKFANQQPTFAPIDFEEVFNGSAGSVRDYYLQVSGGLLDMQSFVTDWIELPEDDIYYAYNDSRWGKPEDMILHASTILGERGFDFTRFDADGDGVIDAVCVIHSGPGYETTGNSDYIHSHFSDLRWSRKAFTTWDGIRVVAYHTAPEFRSNGRDITQIGVIVHETGHFFGLPDLYDYGYDSAGIGMWGLMAAGPWGGPRHDGTVPTHFCAWSKMKLGFVDPLHVQISTGALKLKPADRHRQAILVDALMPGREYFLLENRQQTGYDRYLPGAGLLIYHIDDSRRNNDDQNRYLVDVEQADGKRDLNSSPYAMGDASDPFPDGTHTDFTPESRPSSLPYDADTSIVRIINTARTGEDISLDIVLDGSVGQSLSLLPSSLSFQASQGQEPPQPQAFRLLHQGAEALAWQVELDDAAPWLSLSAESGTTPSELMATVNSSSLAPGLHQAELRFDAGGQEARLSVELEVREPAPIIALEPGRLSFEAYIDKPAPPAKTLQIGNEGGGQLLWWATSQADWIELEPSSGIGQMSIAVRVKPEALEFGEYESGILFAAFGARTVELPLDLVVTPENWPPETPEPRSPLGGKIVRDPRPELKASLATDRDGTAQSYNFVFYQGRSDWPLLTLTLAKPDLKAGEVRARPAQDLPWGYTYRWRVQAVDDKGLAGEWSEEVAFNLLEGEQGCGCASAPAPRLAFWLALLAGWVLFRRTRPRASNPCRIPRENLD